MIKNQEKMASKFMLALKFAKTAYDLFSSKKFKKVTYSGVFIIIQYKAVCPIILFSVSVFDSSVYEMQLPISIKVLTFELRAKRYVNIKYLI